VIHPHTLTRALWFECCSFGLGRRESIRGSGR